MSPAFAIRPSINTPHGLLPLTAERTRLQLPGGPDSKQSCLFYGPYLNAISQFLANDSFHALQTALSFHLQRSVSLHEIKRIELISEKHGALYHVARLKVHFADQMSSLAVNVAVQPEQQAFLDNEYELLNDLARNFDRTFLPVPYLKGEADYYDDQNGHLPLKLFIAGWFEDHHEFHLSSHKDTAVPVISVWDSGSTCGSLAKEQSLSLYSRAAAILTYYLDGCSFQQIYPWHHAAGDFVVKRQGKEVDLRLITVRDYRCLLPPGQNFEDIWIAIVHFFLNLSLRIRLDRFDGTGELAWAGPDCLHGVLAGFLQSWAQKGLKYPHLPSSNEVLNVLRSFNRQEWLPLAQLVMEDGLVEADEVEFLAPRLKDHVATVTEIVNEHITTALCNEQIAQFDGIEKMNEKARR